MKTRLRATTGETKNTDVQETYRTRVHPATCDHRPSPVTTNNSSDPALGTFITMSVVLPLAIVAFLAILINICVLIKNYKLKKKLLAAQNRKSNSDLVEVHESYLEFKKTHVPSGSQDYMDLQQTREEDLGSNLSGYEAIKKGREHPLVYDSPYESVQ